MHWIGPYLQFELRPNPPQIRPPMGVVGRKNSNGPSVLVVRRRAQIFPGPNNSNGPPLGFSLSDSLEAEVYGSLRPV